MGETGIISAVEEDNITLPTVKLNSTQREIQITCNNIKLKNDRDIDDQKMMSKRMGKADGDTLNMIKQQSEQYYKCGDVVIFDNNKTHGFIIKSEKDAIKVVTDRNKIIEISPNIVDRRLVVDRKTQARDQQSQVLQVDDVIKVKDPRS